MAAKNSIKKYVKNGIYHVYNRGVDKRKIFLNDRDYKTFLFYLKNYLLDRETLKKDLQGSDPSRIIRQNFFGRIELLGYCLMPNHFHLILKQTGISDMSEFMKCIMTNYVMYFNDQNNRVGGLFQGRYKALLVEGDDQLLHLSRYIHLNPTELLGSDPCKALAGYDYSSFQDYIGARNTKWMKPEFVLRLNDEEVSGDLETKKKTYKNFVSEYAKDREAIKENLGNLVLE